MELILENIDLLLCGAVVLISAIVFARRGQIQLLRELIISLSSSIDSKELYESLPSITRLLVSDKTVTKLINEAKEC